MRTFYSLQDIEDFISQGITQLVIDENTTITGPARDLLRQHNIPLIQETASPARGSTSAQVRQAPPADIPVSRTGRVPMLQLALDYISVPSAVAMAVQVQEFVDIIEIGTPLIKVAGVEGVKAIREVCPDKYVLADFKTPDVGGLEAQLAFDAGADFVSIIGGATIATVKEALKVANERPGKEIVMECTGVRDILGMAREWKEIGVTRLVYHREWDAQAAGREWEDEDRRQIQEIINMGYNVTVTGGLNPELLPFFAGLDVSVFICGRGIHQAKDPREAARRMRDTIWSIWGRPGASGNGTAGRSSGTRPPESAGPASDSFVDRAVDALKKRK
jgi:3-dehydro-L-gulonate-6-phosphate decarboxylase